MGYLGILKRSLQNYLINLMEESPEGSLEAVSEESVEYSLEESLEKSLYIFYEIPRKFVRGIHKKIC